MHFALIILSVAGFTLISFLFSLTRSLFCLMLPVICSFSSPTTCLFLFPYYSTHFFKSMCLWTALPLSLQKWSAAFNLQFPSSAGSTQINSWPRQTDLCNSVILKGDWSRLANQTNNHECEWWVYVILFCEFYTLHSIRVHNITCVKVSFTWCLLSVPLYYSYSVVWLYFSGTYFV